MDFSLSNLISLKPLTKLNHLSGLVLSALSKGNPTAKQHQLTDSRDVSSEASCFKSILSVIEAQIIPSLIDAHPSKALLQKFVTAQSKKFTSDEIEQFSLSTLPI